MMNSAFFAALFFIAYSLIECYYIEDNKPRYLTAAVGESVVFNCEIDFPQSFPIPYKLFWKKKDKVIYSWQDGRVTEDDEYLGRIVLVDRNVHRTYGIASINITSVRETDAGWFECRTLFPNRTPPWRNNGTWFHLTVSGGNLLAIPPMNKTVMEGDEAEFTCLTKDFEIRVKWFKDGIPIAEYHDLINRSWVTKDNSLIIRPTDSGDTGEYECEAYNYDNERQTARAYLNVQYKAKVVYAPPEIHLPFGQPAIIDCHYRANPNLTTLRWDKDGFLFDPYNVPGVFYKKNGSLYINRVDDSHNGIYTCTPYNDLGSAGASTNMHVIVQTTPKFLKIPDNLYLRQLGETVEMTCDATDGEDGHKPMIIWYKKNGSPLPINRYSIKDGNLTITNIQSDDRGVYQCAASNKAATITVETELLVQNIPSSAPYNLSAVSSPTSVHLSWLLNRHRTNTEFSVWYKSRESTEWKTYLVPSDAMEATIRNLHPDTPYEFMVLVKGDDGVGESKSIVVWTKELEDDIKPIMTSGKYPLVGFPRNVSVRTTDSGLLVTWQRPEYGLEYLKKYVVRWSKITDEYIFGSADTINTSFLITNLLDGEDYAIDVVAVSLDDQQSVSSKVRGSFPGYKSIKAVATGIIAGLAFLAVAFVAVYFIKKKWHRPYPQPCVKN
ncbi:unnamed protein product [Phyllotreta striolata]|uniref:Uncharacterized protein n=1 Tax=Phyllotreta striolata TaxID=444603 RepID=A0A9N9XPH5_PHYSR|nr:unnamed protein product [Phyllotreta striolata]